MNNPHTPAPWKVRWLVPPHTDGVYEIENQFRHLSEQQTNDGESLENVLEANRAMIEAAPHLLAACEAEGRFHEHFDNCDSCSIDDWCPEGNKLHNAAGALRTAAIRKARGMDAPEEEEATMEATTLVAQFKQWAQDHYDQGASVFIDAYTDEALQEFIDVYGGIEAAIAKAKLLTGIVDCWNGTGTSRA